MINLSNAISEAFPACENIENIFKRSLWMRSVRKWDYPEKISTLESGAKVPTELEIVFHELGLFEPRTLRILVRTVQRGRLAWKHDL